MDMTSTEIAELARTAGSTGRTWAQFTCDDAPQEYVCSHDDHDADIATWRAAFDAGSAEHRTAAGWVTRWTTAAVDYDSFGTTSEVVGTWYDRPLRKVLIHPHHVGWHEARYSFGCWSDDPRVEEQKCAALAAQWRADDERREAARTVGMAWLTSLDNDALEAADFEVVEAHGIQIADLRAERTIRRAARNEAARVETWDRCRASVRDGMILVDDGAPATRGRWGVIPGRDAHVYYDVRLSNDWAKIADDAFVIDSSNNSAGSLESVAQQLTSGRLRSVSAEEVPPAKVTTRIGQARWKEIKRVEVHGRTVWVSRMLYALDAIVLDENGRMVRSKAVCVAAVVAAGYPTRT